MKSGDRRRQDRRRQERGWHVDSLASTMAVSTGGVQVSECWSMVADQPLDEVLVELGLDPVTGAGGTLTGFLDAGGGIDVTYGGELVPECWPDVPDGRPLVVIRLPRLLESREPHEFRITLTLPAGPVPHRHVHVPMVPCRDLALRVRFTGPDRVGSRPAAAWVIDATPPCPPAVPDRWAPPAGPAPGRPRAASSTAQLSTAPLPTARPFTTQVPSIQVPSIQVPSIQVPVDAVGEAAACFRGLVPGLAYGLEWFPR